MNRIAVLVLSSLAVLASPAGGPLAQTAPQAPTGAAAPGPAGTAGQIRLGGSGQQGGGAQPAEAGKIMTVITPADTLRIMKDVGFSGLEPYRSGNEEHVVATIDGTGTFIWHENCKENVGCGTLWFMVNFGQQEVTDEYINSYNLSMYYTKLFKNSKGALVLTMAMPLAGGVTEAHVEYLGRLWIRVFKEALQYKPS